MSHLWIRNPDDHCAWDAARLDEAGAAYALCDGPTPLRRITGDDRDSEVLLTAAPPDAGGGERWLLLVGPDADVRVNGRALSATGIGVLLDHDEIRMPAGTRLYFSTEREAQVEPFPGAGDPVFCPRCHQIVEKDTPAVRCPGGCAWYHQTGESPCWTYAPTCAMCPHATDLEAGLTWTPAQL